MSRRRDVVIQVVAPLLFTVLLFVLWEAVCRIFKLPLTILPAPSQVFGSLWQFRVPIYDNALVTLWTTIAGFLIATVFGLLLGIFVGWHRTCLLYTSPSPRD